MMAKLSILALAFLVVLGCGAGSNATEKQASGDTPAAADGGTDGALVAEIHPGGDTRSGNQAEPEAEPVAASPRGETPAPPEVHAAPSGSDDFAKAEARAATRNTNKPAVDTSQLRDAPEWTLRDLDGGVLSSADLEGKVLVLDFWATWCGPCRRSIPHLIELSEQYKDQGVVVVGISMDQQDPQKVVKPFVEHYKITYPIVMGTMKTQMDFGGVRGLPTAFIISQDGKIYRKLVGLRPPQHYEEPIKALLGIS